MFGTHIGHLFVNFESHSVRLFHLTIFGTILIIVSLILHCTHFIRFNTDMYSFSYLLLTAGVGMIVLAYFYTLMDVVLVEYRTKNRVLEEQYLAKRDEKKGKSQQKADKKTSKKQTNATKSDNLTIGRNLSTSISKQDQPQQDTTPDAAAIVPIGAAAAAADAAMAGTDENMNPLLPLVMSNSLSAVINEEE